MTDTQDVSEPSSTLLVTHFDRQVESLRGTLRWLVASGGAVAAAIIAGAQLADFSKRSVCGNILAGSAIAVGLILAFALLLSTSRILTISRPTLTDIDNTEMEAGGRNAQIRLAGDVTDPLMKWIYERASYLLGPFDTVDGLFRRYRELAAALQSTPTEEVKSQITSVNSRIELLESAAHFRTVDLEYSKLVKAIKVGCVVFICAVIVYSLSGMAKNLESPRIATPIAVRVIAPKVLPDECNDRTGVAIAGDIDAPTVVLPPAAKCPATTLTLSGKQPGVVVIPLVAAAQPGTRDAPPSAEGH